MLPLEKESLRPGSIVPRTGIYYVVDHHGEPTGTTIAIESGSLFPPTPESGQRYRLKEIKRRIREEADTETHSSFYWVRN